MIIFDLDVYVINLDRAKERMETFDHRCKEIGQKYIRISAVDRNDLSIPESPGLGPGHLACYLSHYNLWKRMLDKGYPFICIVEDDAHLLRPIKDIQFEKPFDILFLTERIDMNKNFEVTGGCGTEGYIASKQGCEKLLKICDATHLPFDLRIIGFIRTCDHICTENDLLLDAYRSRVPYIKHLEGYSYIDSEYKK